MKTVKIVPGTKMQQNISRLESGDTSVISDIAKEAASVIEAEGYDGAVAVFIGDVVPEEVPSRVVPV